MCMLDRGYTYDILIMDIDRLLLSFPFIECRFYWKNCYGEEYSIFKNWKGS
jgi:hypothetical protein